MIIHSKPGGQIHYATTPRAKVELEESTEYTMFCERIIEEDALLGMDQIRGVMARVVKSSEFSPEIIKNKYFKKD